MLADNLDPAEDELDAALADNLDPAEDELDAALAEEFQDDDEEIDLDYGNEDAMQFTIEEEIESGQPALADGDDTNLVLVEESTLDSLADVNTDSSDSRIFYFPDNTAEDKDIDAFESEVKMTLQAIRDQLQHMTERLFQQERTTIDLKQSIADLNDASSTSGTRKNKKSS